MNQTADKPLTGRKVALIVCSAFAVIISVNLTLAYQAVATFPGLEVKNSYVASQNFDADRAAQQALNWDVVARISGHRLTLQINADGVPVQPIIHSAVLGRATNVSQDEFPELRFNGAAFTANVAAGDGNWNLRLVAIAEDGTVFKQRIIVDVVK